MTLIVNNHAIFCSTLKSIVLNVIMESLKHECPRRFVDIMPTLPLKTSRLLVNANINTASAGHLGDRF